MESMIENKCPNCGGELQLSSDRTKKICLYCDSEFAVETKPDTPEPVKRVENNIKINQAAQLFQIKTDIVGMESWDYMCALINDGTTVGGYMKMLEPLAQTHPEWAMNHVHEDLWRQIETRVGSKKLPGENYLVYKDSGVISKGKKGRLISDKQVYFIGKNKIRTLVIGDLHSLEIASIGGTWYLNGDLNLNMDSIASSNKELGVLMALICTLARNQHPVGYKIAINNAY